MIAFGLCVAAGLFLVRRRTDEAHVLFTRGEAATVFAARTGLEALLPRWSDWVPGSASPCSRFVHSPRREP